MEKYSVNSFKSNNYESNNHKTAVGIFDSPRY